MWEYKRVEFFDGITNLNSYGRNGWELVGVESPTWKTNAIYVFKRQRK